MMRHYKLFALLGTFIAVLMPKVWAFQPSGIGALDRVIEIIAGIFNVTILGNDVVQVGFLRFLLFVALFAVMYKALNGVSKVFDAKTAKIVALVFAIIGVFLMPRNWLLATGGTITFVVSSLVFVLIFWGLSYVAVAVLKKGWLFNGMGLILLFLLLMMLGQWSTMVGIG